MQISSISRGAGRSVVAAAAYRAGERLRDERSGRLYNYSKRTDVPHKELLLPNDLDASQIPWVKERAELWNAAERAERRWDARVAREFQIGLPHELSADQRRDLARAFSQELADRYQAVVDLAVHEPRPAGDSRNHHAHLLLTSREITANGFGAKTGLDLESAERQRRGLLAGIPEIKAVRERWSLGCIRTSTLRWENPFLPAVRRWRAATYSGSAAQRGRAAPAASTSYTSITGARPVMSATVRWRRTHGRWWR